MGNNATVTVLDTTRVSDVGRDSGVDDDDVFPGVRVDWKGAQNEEPTSRMKLACEVLQDWAELRQREVILVDMSKGLLQIWNI